MNSDSFGFGVSNTMREVPPGTEAIISFNGEPTTIDTDWGVKYSFPILIHRHDSYPNLEEPLGAAWQSKSQGSKQLFNDLTKETFDAADKNYQKELTEHYNKSKWQLTRFDTGVYYLSVLKND